MISFNRFQKFSQTSVLKAKICDVSVRVRSLQYDDLPPHAERPVVRAELVDDFLSESCDAGPHQHEPQHGAVHHQREAPHEVLEVVTLIHKIPPILSGLLFWSSIYCTAPFYTIATQRCIRIYVHMLIVLFSPQ